MEETNKDTIVSNTTSNTNNTSNREKRKEFIYNAIEGGWTVKKIPNSVNKFEMTIPISETSYKNIENSNDSIETKIPSRRAISAPIIKKISRK